MAAINIGGKLGARWEFFAIRICQDLQYGLIHRNTG